MTDKTPIPSLAQLQALVRAPKNRRNQFGGFDYRSAEDIFAVARPVCNAAGCALVVTDDIVAIVDRFYVKATALVLGPDNQPMYSSVAYAREAASKKGMDESQVTGSAGSYARKYALAGLFGIDNEQDVDATSKGSDGLTEKQILEIEKLCDAHKFDVTRITQAYKVERLQDLDARHYASIIKRLEKLGGAK